MTIFPALHKRRLFYLAIFVLTFSIFTADICDLREELQIVPCLSASIDDDITTGVTERIVFDPAPLLAFSPAAGASSVAISSLHLPACGFRAPPCLS